MFPSSTARFASLLCAVCFKNGVKEGSGVSTYGIFVLQKLHVLADSSAENQARLLEEWNYIHVSVSHSFRSVNMFFRDLTRVQI